MARPPDRVVEQVETGRKPNHDTGPGEHLRSHSALSLRFLHQDVPWKTPVAYLGVTINRKFDTSGHDTRT
ncbi:unnamed protein product [Pieris macdunnoughi]|uniref:Uncharacterized protein n=1 Tax=Pieris macdunnoughi TaxID=345717 RepID=A0A821LJL4_9NEOP|nr:unnamed protein product [Pieris macdunnoughi]